MSALALVAHESIGAVFFRKLLGFRNQPPQRRQSTFATIDGDTVHQVTATTEADRVITGNAILNPTKLSTLKSLHNSSTNLIMTFQDGENVYKGHLNISFVSNSRRNSSKPSR